MSSKLSKKLGILAFVFLVSFVVSGLADENVQQVYHKDGLYLGVQGNYLIMGGDAFDDQTAQMALYVTTETMWVPKIDNGFGFGAVFGFRDGGFGMELGFMKGSFDGTIYDGTYDSSVMMFDLNLKLWLSETSAIQPYLLIGGELSYFTATDAAELNYYPYTVGDTDMNGLSVALGGGISYYILPEIALNVGVNYHIIIYMNVSGPLETSYEMEDYVNASMLNINAGLTVTLD